VFLKKLIGSIFSLLVLISILISIHLGTIVYFDINNKIAIIFIVATYLYIAEKLIQKLSIIFIGDLSFFRKFLMSIGGLSFVSIIVILILSSLK
jgi:hypothetical protein